MLFKRLTTVGNGFEIFTSGNRSVGIRFAGSQTAVRLALGASFLPLLLLLVAVDQARTIIKWAAFGPFEHTGAAPVPEMRHSSSDGRPARTLVQVDHAVRCRRRTQTHQVPNILSSSLLPPASSSQAPGSRLQAPALDLVPRSQVSHPTWRPLSGAPCRRCDIAPAPPPTASSLT